MTRLACLLSSLLFFFGSNVLSMTSSSHDRWWSRALGWTAAILLSLFLASFRYPAVHRNLRLVLQAAWGCVVFLILVAIM